jgi:hypothetical protein
MSLRFFTDSIDGWLVRISSPLATAPTPQPETRPSDGPSPPGPVDYFKGRQPEPLEGFNLRERARRLYLGVRKREYVSFVCGKYVNWAAVRTDDNHLWLAYTAQDADLACLMNRCDDLSTRVGECLAWRSRRNVVQRLFNVAHALITIMDERTKCAKPGNHGTSSEAPDKVFRESLDHELDHIADTIELLMRRNARARYVGGVYLGMFVALMILAFISTENNIIDRYIADFIFGAHLPSPPETMMYSMLAGVIGAVTSVLLRLAQNDLAVDERAQAGHQVMFGAMRAVLGVALGAMAYLFLEANLVEFTAIPEDNPAARQYFFIALAFVAGFSERFMQGAIEKKAPFKKSDEEQFEHGAQPS